MMKRTRILIALLLVVIMTLGMPLSALAATHDVGTADDVLNVVATDTDAEVTMNMKNDIDMGYMTVTGNEGQSYTINGNGNTMSNVAIDSCDVTINADVDGDNYISGDADVTVNGDVETVNVMGEANLSVDGDVSVVDASGKSDVEITGDVGSVAAWEESAVDITGDVVGNEYSWSAISANENAQVNVDGNVSGSDGYIAPEDMDESISSSGGAGIEATGNAVVSVTGDVNGGDGVMTDVAMEDPTNYGDGGSGINAYGDVTVTVGGNVTGGNAMGTYGYSGDGINAYDGAKITVGGNVTAGDVVADPEVDVHIEEYEYEDGTTESNPWNSNAGDGIETDSTTTITVGGNVTGGSTNADGGNGGAGLRIDSYYENEENPEENKALGSITIGGTVSGGTGDADSEIGSDGHDVAFNGYVGITEDLVAQLLKMDAEDLIDEDGYPTEQYFILIQIMYLGVGDEKVQEYIDKWIEDNGYTEEVMAEWTDEEMLKKELELIQSILAKEEIDIAAVNEELADKFSKLSIGEYDDDPTFFSYDDETGAMAAAYMDANVKPLATTPATGDSFNVILVTTIAVVALLGMGAVLVIRKKTY